jgi:cell division protein FtsZ
MKQAEAGVEALQKVVDTLIIIPNQNLFRLANEKTTFTDAFALADDVLYQGVKGVTDLMVRPGLINLDFADVRAVMDEMGKAMMGTGEANGEDRAIQAAEKAIANPLLDEISLRGAKGVLINITGGYDLTLFELDEAANRIREEVDAEANIIVGSTLDTDMDDVMRVSVVATGIDASEMIQDIPVPRRSMAAPLAAAPVAAAAQPDVPAAGYPSTESFDAPRETFETEMFPEPEVEPVETGFFDEIDTAVSDDLVDDLPPPAYAPPVHEAPVQTEFYEEAEPEAAMFVAPRAPTPGVPSSDAMARLQAAVRNAPKQQPVVPAARESAPAAGKPGGEKSRFGINSLISRMTGHNDEGAGTAASAARQQPPVQHYEADPEVNEEQERIEIPAFLRRQAN